jgi:hypothetical protein
VVRKPYANFAGKLRMTEIHRNDCFGSLSDSHVRPRPLSAKLAQTWLISALREPGIRPMVLTLHSNDGRLIISSTSFCPETFVAVALFFFRRED